MNSYLVLESINIIVIACVCGNALQNQAIYKGMAIGLAGVGDMNCRLINVDTLSQPCRHCFGKREILFG